MKTLNEATTLFMEALSEGDENINGWYPFETYRRYMKGEKVDENSLKKAALTLVSDYSYEIAEFESTDVANIRVRKSRGENYRICLRGKQKDGSERDFQVTVWVPLLESVSSDKVKLLLVEGLSTEILAYEDKFVCEEEEEEGENGGSDTDSDYTARFLRTHTKTHIETSEGDIPREFDWRSSDSRVGTKCKAQIEEIYDQGQCGACYAHAVSATLADRACIAAAVSRRPMRETVRDLTSTHASSSNVLEHEQVRFSANDMLTCGTKEEGKICVPVRCV